ncbi:hypothetical protein ACSTLN_23860, partial [Vibrio parahaemolyticus]
NGLPFDLDHELVRDRTPVRAGRPVAVDVAGSDEEVPPPVEERDDVVTIEVVRFSERDAEFAGPVDPRQFRADPGVHGILARVEQG